MMSFAEEQILSWLERLGCDGTLEFRRNPIGGWVEIGISGNGRRILQRISLEEMHMAKADVLVMAVERSMDRL